MTEEEWDALPVERVFVADIVYMLDGLSIQHIWPDPLETQGLAEGPIRLAMLSDGKYLVRDGRHRVIRAQLAWQDTIQARVMRYG